MLIKIDKKLDTIINILDKKENFVTVKDEDEIEYVVSVYNFINIIMFNISPGRV